MNNATLFACQQRLGDFGRFISTASVARDLDEIRKALGEEDVSGYFVSYGTGIGQTYVNMFPDRAKQLLTWVSTKMKRITSLSAMLSEKVMWV